ncbi:amidase [Paraburkholderia sp. JHI869]|uniref:amidase n=1 Tax=Paraburkholderia sp. JHI869 TaxID=3112959 RepID=UPI00317E1DA2
MNTKTDIMRVYLEQDAVGLGRLIKAKEISSIEALDAAVEILERLNPELNAVSQTCFDVARECARTTSRGGVFSGVPFLAKDLATSAAGLRTTNSSKFFSLHNSAPAVDNEVVTRMRKSGLNILGFTNVPENGWSLTTEPKLNGPTRNPWNVGRTAGGSSGGAAAAVAAGIVPLAEASDAAGSIRMPAAMCGIVGLKPSRGRVSVSPAPDFFHGGAVFLCLSRTVRDTAAYLDAVAGGLPGEPYTPAEQQDGFLAASQLGLRKLRVGFSLASPDGSPVDSQISAGIERVARLLASHGHDVEAHDLKFDILDCWSAFTRMAAVQTAGFVENGAASFGVELRSEEFEPYTWSGIQKGRSIDALTHARDIDAIRRGGIDIAKDIHAYDVFISPVMRRVAFGIGTSFDMSCGDWERYNAEFLKDAACLFPFNVSGQPAISLPLFQSDEGLPIGIQFAGRYGDEATLLQVASVLEQELPWSGRVPTVHAASDFS